MLPRAGWRANLIRHKAGSHRSRFLLLSLWLGLVSVISADWVQAQSAVSPQSQREKHSVIQEIDGFAQLSETMTVAEVRQMAFANAKRQALESTQTHIQSNTVMKDGQIEYDIVTVAGEGKVRVLAQKDLGIEKNSRYHVWIKAEVAYALKPTRPAVQHNTLMDVAAPLTVKVWTEQEEYREGDRIVIFMRGNRPFYARIVNYTSTGEAIQLLPNDYRPRARFKAGEIYRIPDGTDGFALEVRPPYGTERIVVYASEEQLGRVQKQPLQGGLNQLEGSREDLGNASRAIQVRSKSKTAEFYEATWTFSTHR